jgi:hypothetical protein
VTHKWTFKRSVRKAQNYLKQIKVLINSEARLGNFVLIWQSRRFKDKVCVKFLFVSVIFLCWKSKSKTKLGKFRRHKKDNSKNVYCLFTKFFPARPRWLLAVTSKLINTFFAIIIHTKKHYIHTL